MNEGYDIFKTTYDQSTKSEFEKYLDRHKYCEKWLIATDYCFNDKHKSNSSFSVVVAPYILDFDGYKRIVNSVISKDIKNVRSINDNVGKLYKSGLFYSFGFLVDFSDYKHLFKLEDGTKRLVTSHHIDLIIEMIEAWIANEGNRSSYLEQLKVFKRLKEKAKAKNFNHKLFEAQSLVTFFVGIICTHIIDYADAKTIGWFSDRGKIFSNGKDFIAYMLNNNISAFMQHDGIEKKYQLVVGEPNGQGVNWYDSLIRLPDYIAGSLADIRFVNPPQATHEKHGQMIENVLIGNHFLSIIKMTRSDSDISFGRIVLSTK